MAKQFLKTCNGSIVGANNKPVFLKGLNLGGWLMMEAYFMHSPNLPEHLFKQKFAGALGEKALEDFEESFRDNFIRESDFKWIAQNGFNCLRVPFNCRLVEAEPYIYDLDKIGYLDKVVSWAEKYKLWVILDLHAAPGCQNHDWHSDSAGKAELWTRKDFQDRTYALWSFIAERYKDNDTVAGYDLLNEAVLDDTKILNKFYKNLIKEIRRVDKNHILFIEGNKWAMDIACLDEVEDDNYSLSIHGYIPLEFTFNFIPQLKYPLKGNGGKWDKSSTRKHLMQYKKISDERKVPIFVGEFGVNGRDGLYGEDLWLADTLECFKEMSFHWTYWTYKAVKNSAFPDGVFSYFDNPPWVNRQGPLMGWETYPALWKDKKEEMIASWLTEAFKINGPVLKVLKKHAR